MRVSRRKIMKRVTFLFAIMVIIIVSFTSITAFADNITLPNDYGSKESSIDVKATYKIGGEEKTVYSVDLVWGSMSFTYTSAFKGNWNPATHEYDGATESKWDCKDGANVIKVTNHSNASVSLSFTYKSETNYPLVTGRFDNNEITLQTAENTTRENAPTNTTTLILSGDLPSGIEANNEFTIGTINITLK